MLKNPREAVLWLAVHHQQKKALELFAMEIASAGTSMGEFEYLHCQHCNANSKAQCTNFKGHNVATESKSK